MENKTTIQGAQNVSVNNKTIIQKTQNLPVAILPTMVGAATLSNVFSGMGYPLIRHITMIVSFFVLIFYIIKMICYTKTCLNEYSNVVPASLYAGFTMIVMILGSYFFEYSPALGKILWVSGLCIHAVHILIFTYRNVLKGVKADTFVPSWFVTYNGILVSAVIGGPMKEPLICRIIAIYGIAVFCIIIPFMIMRIIKKPIVGPVLHTRAIVMAPSSLCIVAYFNFFENPNQFIVYFLYAAVFASLIFIIYNIPKFFSVPFNPGFAGLTFPMAIGVVASGKMSDYLINNNMLAFGNAVKQIQGIQLYLTTAIIAFVLYNFFIMLKNSFKTA